MKRNLVTMFNPRSVAVVGASRERKKLGNILLQNIIDSGYKGTIYPVNPKAKSIGGRTCYPSYSELPKAAELAIVSIPAAFVPGVLREIGEKGTRDVVIITAGFKEMGADELETEMLKAVEEYKLNILGPNCLGFVNNRHHINATFGQVVNTFGALRFISQSGAIASSIFDWAEATGMGFDTFVTLGNKSQIGENEVLEYWLRQDPGLEAFNPETNRKNELSGYQPVGMYLESIVEGKEFLRLCRQMTQKNPVFVLKPGKSEGAVTAMQSHTGSIAGADAVFDSALAEAGVIRCEGVEDLFDLCRAFAWEDAPKGNRIGVVSNAGGPAVITADFVELEGMSLAEVTKKAEREMKKQLPEAAALHNPIDVLGDALATRYEAAMEAVLAEKGVDALLVILTPQVMTEIKETAEAVAKMSRKYGKPIVCSFMGGRSIVAGEKVLDEHKIPSFRYPERAVRTLAKMHWWWSNFAHTRRHIPALRPGVSARAEGFITKTVENAQTQKRRVLTSWESNEILRVAKLPVPEALLVNSLKEANDFAYEHGWPVVLKVSSPNLLHKIDQGGIMLNLKNRAQLGYAYREMSDIVRGLRANGDTLANVQIQKQVDSGVEVIVGVKRDAVFGPVMMFGAGGTLAELIVDRNLGLLPIDEQRAEELVKGSKVWPLLKGFRGEKPYAYKKLYSLMAKLAGLMDEFDGISEVEINPVILTHTDVWAVDGKALVTV